MAVRRVAVQKLYSWLGISTTGADRYQVKKDFEPQALKLKALIKTLDEKDEKGQDRINEKALAAYVSQLCNKPKPFETRLEKSEIDE